MTNQFLYKITPTEIVDNITNNLETKSLSFNYESYQTFSNLISQSSNFTIPNLNYLNTIQPVYLGNFLDGAYFEDLDIYIAIDANNIYSSNNGENYIKRYTYSVNLTKIFYTNGLIIVGGESKTLISSADGINWTLRLSTSGGAADIITDIKYGYYHAAISQVYLAVTSGGSVIINWFVATSDTFKTFNKLVQTPTNYMLICGYDSIAGAGAVFGLNQGGGANPIYLDATGTGFVDFIYDNIRYITVGDGVAISTDGVTFTNTSTSISANKIYEKDGFYITIGDNGEINTSPDGTNWTSRTSGVSEDLHDILYCKNAYFVCGDNGTIITSTDGITWRDIDTTGYSTTDFYSISYNTNTETIYFYSNTGIFLLNNNSVFLELYANDYIQVAYTDYEGSTITIKNIKNFVAEIFGSDFVLTNNSSDIINFEWRLHY